MPCASGENCRKAEISGNLRTQPINMKNYLIIAALASLCFACERKEVTINPAGETKETTIVTPAPAPEKTTEKTTETNTTTTPEGTTTEKTETTEEK